MLFRPFISARRLGAPPALREPCTSCTVRWAAHTRHNCLVHEVVGAKKKQLLQHMGFNSTEEQRNEHMTKLIPLLEQYARGQLSTEQMKLEKGRIWGDSSSSRLSPRG